MRVLAAALLLLGAFPLHAQMVKCVDERRVVSVNPQGERTFMDDGVRQQRIGQLRTDIARGCS